MARFLAVAAVIATTAVITTSGILSIRPVLVLNIVVIYSASFAAFAIGGRAGLTPVVQAALAFLLAACLTNTFDLLRVSYLISVPVSSTVTRFYERRAFTLPQQFFGVMVWTSLLQYTVLLAPTLFDERRAGQRLKTVRRIIALPFFSVISAVAIFALLLPQHLFDGSPIAAVIGYMLALVMILALVVALVSVWGAARAADPDARQRALLLSAGIEVALVTICAAAVAFTLGGVDYRVGEAAFQFGLLIIILSTIAGVFFRGLLDPALLIRRTTVAAGLGLIGVFTAAALGNAAQDMLARFLGLTGMSATMLLGGVLAIAILPFRAPLSRLSDKLLLRLQPALTNDQSDSQS